MVQVRVRKRGKTFSYIFAAGKVDGRRKVVEKGGYLAKGEAYNDFLHGNIGITSELITLADFMTNWLANVVAANVKRTIIAPERFAELLSKYSSGTLMYIPLLLLYHTGETLAIFTQNWQTSRRQINDNH